MDAPLPLTNILQIHKKPRFENEIIKYEFRTFLPNNPNALGHSDIVEITMQHQDALTATFDSRLYMEGSVTEPANEAIKLVQNAFLHLFKDITFQLNQEDIETVRTPGILTTLKTYLLSDDYESLSMAGFNADESKEPITYNKTTKKFFCEIPLKMIFSFAADYNYVIANMKQTLKLTRAHVDTDVYKSTVADSKVEIKLEKIEWRIPFLQVNEKISRWYLNLLENDAAINMWYRKFEIIELPALKELTNEVWDVKTVVERLRYVFVALQTDKRWKGTANATTFDHCDVSNMRVFLNSNVYPLENLNLNIDDKNYVRAYQMYQDIFESYHGKLRTTKAPLSYDSFLNRFVFAFDISKQNEGVKPSITDLKIELTTRKAIPANTRAYCVLVGDAEFEYKPLSNIVTKII